MLVLIFIYLLCMSLSWHEIRYRTFQPAPSSVSGPKVLSDDVGDRQGQLVPAAGAAAGSPDQEGDKGQVRSSTAGRLKGSNRSYGKSPCLEHRKAPCRFSRETKLYGCMAVWLYGCMVVWFGRQVTVCVHKRHKNAIFGCSRLQKFNFDCLLINLLICSPTTENIFKFVCPLLTQPSMMISGT